MKYFKGKKTCFFTSLSTPTLFPETPHLLNHRIDVYAIWLVGYILTTYCEQANRQNFHIWKSHRQHAARLFDTTAVRSAFSAIVWLLIKYANDFYFIIPASRPIVCLPVNLKY